MCLASRSCRSGSIMARSPCWAFAWATLPTAPTSTAFPTKAGACWRGWTRWFWTHSGSSPIPRIFHGKCLLQRKMRGMGLEPECVQNQRVQPLQQAPAFVGNAVDVGAVGKVAHAKAQHGERAMIEPDRHDLLAKHFERDSRLNSHEVDFGHEARRPVLGGFAERVREDALDALLGVLLAEDGNRTANPLREQARVVQSEQMIGMVMREGDRVHPPHPFAEQLHPHLGRRVDEEITGWESQQHAGPGPLVARIARGADRAITPQDRNARGRSGSQKDQPPRRSSRDLDQPYQPPGCRKRGPAGSISGCLRSPARNRVLPFYEKPGRSATRAGAASSLELTVCPRSHIMHEEGV